MKSPFIQRLALRVLAMVAVGLVAVASAQKAAPANRAAKEKEACIKNLKAIYEAVDAYQVDRHDLPNWLSDLVPQYLPDVNALVCPVCRRTGQIQAPPLADPKLPTSYIFEFCPVPLGKAGTNAPARTRREWRRRQMGLVGSMVPLVRCLHHDPVLNVAFDGKVYESPPAWETLVTNRVSAADLTAARLFGDARPPAARPPGKAAAAADFPPRDPAAPKGLLDLTPFYNACLTESWHRRYEGNDLGSLPKGLQSFRGVEFDVRGIIQLGSHLPAATNFPALLEGIPVHQKAQQVHFLHAAGFGTPQAEGKQIGTYLVHFKGNQARLEIPIRYGHEVRDWHPVPGEPAAPPELVVAWEGSNAFTRPRGKSVRLFLTTWTNLAPELEIESIDYVSAMAMPAPFLIAISVE